MTEEVTMLNFRHLTAAMFLASGRIPAGTHNPNRAEDTAAQALLGLASKVDNSQEAAMLCADRLQRQLVNFMGGASVGRLDTFAVPDARNAAELGTHVAKAEMATELFADLFHELSGIWFLDAARTIRVHMGDEPLRGYVTLEWVTEAAGLLLLAKAYRDEALAIEQAMKDAAQAAREAAALAAVEAKATEKAERARLRKFEQANARARKAAVS
jgi:hypothetical protein